MDSFDVGVIVGRFQVPELHAAHRSLISQVCEAHDKVLIFLGLSPLMVTRENPLDFEARKQMILEAFPDVTVLYIKDRPDDEVWSRYLDAQIQDCLTASQTAVLYGGRDSFIDRYYGSFDTRELEPEAFLSGTDIRKAVSRKVKASPDFRSGVVWSAYSRFPTVYTTVDVAVLDRSGDHPRILLARKPDEKLYRLIGGFADPRTLAFEEDASREVMEEAHVEIGSPEYLGSFNIDDWRYRGEADIIRTLLYRADYLFGSPRPDDDIEELRWFPLFNPDPAKALKRDQIVENHRPLLDELVARELADRNDELVAREEAL